MQEYFNNLVQNYPWATEEALEMLNSELTEGNMTIAKVAAILGDGSKATEVAQAKDQSQTAEKKAEKAKSAVETNMKNTSSAMKKVMSNAEPANAIAELSHEVSKVLYNAGATVGNFLGPAAGKISKGVRMATKAGGYAMVTATGIGVVYAKLLTEQDKYARQLINYGSVVSDVDLYTTLRSSIRGLGMGFKMYADVTESALPFITASEGDVFKGQIALSQFLQDINDNESFRDFGMTIQQQSQFLAQEAETLYQLGELDKMNAQGQDILINAFEGANKLGLFMADSLGQSRMDTLKLREEARNSDKLITGILQNAQFMNEHLGEQASANVQAAVGYFAPLAQATFGDEFREMFQRSVEATVGDIPFDQDAMNNIPQEFKEKLQTVGPGVLQMFEKMVEDTATGKISSPAEAVARQREFVKLVEQQLPKLAGQNELLNWANGFIAQAKVIPDTFTTADIQELVDPNFIADTAESADSTIDTLDNMSVTFQNIQEVLTPGFGTIGNSADFLTKNLLRFGKAVSGFFGGSDRFNEMYNEGVQEVINDHLAVVNEKNIDATIQAATQSIDTFEKQKEELLEEIEEAKSESETGQLSADEQATSDQNLRVLDEQLEIYRNYHKKLLEKKKEFASKDAEDDGMETGD
tara:strand:+ start:3790 stop:5715 length:1926 start_codon:yes stop_codon:yes gene_type:complete